MGQSLSGGLTQYDVEEVIEHCEGRLTQGEVEMLYKRFRSLDRGRKGFLTGEELLAIPEVSINPLHQRLVRLFGSCNFKEFAYLISFFSPLASRQDKLKLMFKVYDVDGDGVVSAEDVEMVVRQLGGSALSDSEIKEVVERVMREAGAKGKSGITPELFAAALEGEENLRLDITLPKMY